MGGTTTRAEIKPASGNTAGAIAPGVAQADWSSSLNNPKNPLLSFYPPDYQGRDLKVAQRYYHGQRSSHPHNLERGTSLPGLRKAVESEASDNHPLFTDAADVIDVNGRGLFCTDSIEAAIRYAGPGGKVYATEVIPADFLEFRSALTGLGSNQFYSLTGAQYSAELRRLGARGARFLDTELFTGAAPLVLAEPDRFKNRMIGRFSERPALETVVITEALEQQKFTLLFTVGEDGRLHDQGHGS